MDTQDLRSLVQIRRRGMYVYALPNLLTSGNLVLGFLSVLFAVDQHFEKAAWCIILASLFDMLDGRVARLTNTTSKFGIEYDSLCDLISFGLAPAILMYYGAIKDFGRLGMAVAMIFALCGALRLARFNVLAAVLPKSYFQGLPIPLAANVVACLVFFARDMGFSIEHNPGVLGYVLALALLMVSTIKFPSFKDFHFRQRRSFGALAIMFAVLVGLIAWFEAFAFLFLNGYILFSLLTELWRFRKRRPVESVRPKKA